MKIGIICFPSYGGSGVLATELGWHLAQLGKQVHFVSYDQPFRLKFHENIFYHRVNTPHYDLFPFPPYYLALVNKIAQVVEEQELDVVHAHYAVPHALAAQQALAMVNREVGLVTTLHGTDITLVGNNESFFRTTRHAIKNSPGLTAVSNDLIKSTREVFATDRPIRCIYNFVDPREYRRLEPENIPCRLRYRSKGEKLLIHISNFREVKRVGDVVKVFAEVQKEISSRLLLVGDGPTRDNVAALVREKGLEEKVVFLGAQDNVVSLLSISDLLVLTSEKEAFGLVNIEAMACEVPVLAAEAGGIPEVIANGETGFLVPVGDVEKMAKMALKVLKNPGLQKEMGLAGRQRVIDNFSSDIIVPQYLEYYREIMGKGAGN